QMSVRPNPAAFDPDDTDVSNPDGQYGDSSLALAAFGGRLRSTLAGFTNDAAYFALRDMQFDLTSGVIPWWTSTVPAGSTSFGIESAAMDIDWQSISPIGQPFRDEVGGEFGVANGVNALGGTLGGAFPVTLVLPLNVPFTFEIDGQELSGTMT